MVIRIVASLLFLPILSFCPPITLRPPGGLPLTSLWVCAVWTQQEGSRGRAASTGPAAPPAPPPALLQAPDRPSCRPTGGLFLVLRPGQHASEFLHKSSGAQSETCLREDPHWAAQERRYWQQEVKELGQAPKQHDPNSAQISMFRRGNRICT